MRIKHLVHRGVTRKVKFVTVLEHAYDHFVVSDLRDFVYQKKFNSVARYFTLMGYKDLDKVRKSFTNGDIYA